MKFSFYSEIFQVEYLDERIDSDENVEPVLDENAGLWDISIANKLYDLAKQCLEEKKKRPETAEVHAVLQELVNQKMNLLLS